MKKTPLISIIMPVYNPEFSDLNKAILSCINQTYQSWELCICDDCSTKPYVKPLIKKFISKDKRIKAVFSEKNEHISAASNKVLSLAKGDYIGFLDHDDELDKKALEEIAKSIKENNPDMIYTDEAVLNKNNLKEPIFKPDFSPENLMSCNYIVHFVVVKKEIIKKIKGFEIGTEGAQDYDLVLKISEITKNIIHISKILYYWRKSKHSILNNINNKPYVINAGKKVLEHALKRRKIQGDVEITKNFGIYKVNYKIINNPKVSIIVSFKDKANITKNCIESILKKTAYINYEIILIDNNSNKQTLKYLGKIKNKKIKILHYNNYFNFSKINNFASKFAKGEYLLVLNNDIKILSRDWLEEMLSICQQKEIGIVGAKMIFPNGKIQHAGISYDSKKGFYQSYYKFNGKDKGYSGHNMIYRRNCISVLGACLMIKKDIFNSINGFDENLAVEKNDVDICLRIWKKGFQVVFTPFTKILHYESSSRKGLDISKDNNYFSKKYKELKDPFTNENITLDEDFIKKSSPYCIKRKIYSIPYYCYKEHGIKYTLKKCRDFILNPKKITELYQRTLIFYLFVPLIDREKHTIWVSY